MGFDGLDLEGRLSDGDGESGEDEDFVESVHGDEQKEADFERVPPCTHLNVYGHYIPQERTISPVLSLYAGSQ